MLRLAVALGAVNAVAASAGQGCYDTSAHTCGYAVEDCSPYSCNVQGGTMVWVSAPPAQMAQT